MKRLIDANAYEHAVQGNPYVSDSVKTYVRCSIQSQPTVDAIPIEWIMRYSFDGKRKRPISITKMIADWRKEHAETD